MSLKGSLAESIKMQDRLVTSSEAFAYRIMSELAPNTRIDPTRVCEQALEVLDKATNKNAKKDKKKKA